MCPLLGTLVGVTAAGGHPQNVLSVFTDPVVPADANSHRPDAKPSAAVTETAPATTQVASSPRRGQESRICIRTTVPAAEDRIWTRSQSWFAIHRPRP